MEINKSDILSSYVDYITRYDLPEYQRLNSDFGYICYFMERYCSTDVIVAFKRYLKENDLIDKASGGINECLGITCGVNENDLFVYQSIRYMVLEHFLDWLDKKEGSI